MNIFLQILKVKNLIIIINLIYRFNYIFETIIISLILYALEIISIIILYNFFNLLCILIFIF